MLMTTQVQTAAGQGASHRLVLTVVLSVLAVLAAIVPAAAMAGSGSGGGGSSGPCEATVTATQDPAVASISVDCGDGNGITSVQVDTTEDGSLEDETGTDCSDQESARNFTCEPSDPPESLLTFRFKGDSGDICAAPRLNVDFEVDLEDGSTENIDNVEAANCSEDSGDSGGGGGGGNDDEDDGATPEGGVDSGAGGSAEPSAPPAAALPLAGAALIVLALVSAGLILRKSRTTP